MSFFVYYRLYFYILMTNELNRLPNHLILATSVEIKKWLRGKKSC